MIFIQNKYYLYQKTSYNINERNSDYMNKIDELDRNLKVAYLNYENDDLNETLKYLDRMVNEILKYDESLNNDPFWKILSIDVFKAVILNNFYNKKEMTGNDLASLLGNTKEMKRNLQEFCNNFKDNNLIKFISHIENIADNLLKDVIKIIIINLGKMNILNNNVTSESKDIHTNINAIEKNKIEKITQSDVIEIVDKKSKKSKIYDIKNHEKNIVTTMNVSYFQDGKEIQEEKTIFAFNIVDANENFITIKTNPMCEVKDGKINLNHSETIFKLTKNSKLFLNTPTMDGGFNFELIIKENPNYRDYHQTLTESEKKDVLTHVNKVTDNAEQINNQINDNQLISKLRMSYNDVFEDWELLKNKKQTLKEFFDETERNAVKEIYEAKDKATVYGTKLSQFLENDNLTCNDEIIKLLINYFGSTSIYDKKFGTNENGLLCEKLSIDNVGLFRAVLVINVISIIEHITDSGLPLSIDLTFEEKVFVEMLGPIFKTFIPKIFDNITEVKFYYKQDSL